jgi:RHS repeat-associated protein
VATDKGYTKHYYAENERIASKIGGGGLTEFGHPLLRNKSFVKKMKANSTMMDKVLVGCLNAKYYEVKPVLQHLYDWQDSVQPEDNCYWYHPDHLGSSSWITHTNGHTVQHLHYLPWGEDFVDQKTTSFSSMYTFSAKEKDTETGYSYFGARYYSSDLSEWLSVDPMAAKYPSLSPYTYCADNPVKCVDPNGEENINFDDWYLNLKNGRIEHRDGSENLFREGLIRLAGDDAKVSDIEKALSDKGYDFRKDPAIPGGYVVYTEQAYKGWEMWCKIPYAAMTFSYEIPNANLLKKFEHGIKFVKNKIFSRGPRYYEYTKTVMSRMKDPSRYVPVSIVDDVIRYPVRTGPDPRGTSATMYYSTMRRNGKLYNIEILYDSEQNLIFHIMYSQKQLGPMPAIK